MINHDESWYSNATNTEQHKDVETKLTCCIEARKTQRQEQERQRLEMEVPRNCRIWHIIALELFFYIFSDINLVDL